MSSDYNALCSRAWLVAGQPPHTRGGRMSRVTVALVDDRPMVEHTCVDGERVMATLNNRDWQVVTADPLEVRPSIACDRCGLHGWIAGGMFWTVGGPG